MPVWTIHSDLKVTYVGSEGHEQDCGKAEDGVLRPEVEAWVITSAAVGDRVLMAGQVFVRQSTTGVN